MKRTKQWSLCFLTILSSLAFPFPIQSKEVGLSLLEKTSQAFTEVADKAMPATVYIKAQIAVQQEYMNPFDMFGDDFLKKFFGAPQPFGQPQQPQQQMSGGSGFLVSPDGFIVTNYHVIKDASQITVMLNDGREYPAHLKGTDPRTDLAVLKIEEDHLPFLQFGDSDSLKVGEWVVAIGNPFGLEATLTVGVVSAKGRQDLGIATFEDFIQTDAAINPGNSGGALLNLDGEVVGVNTAIFTRSGGYMGIGLAIPSRMAQNIVPQIIDNGSVKRAYLGIVMQPLDKELSDALGLEKQEGILISDVVPDSPAAKAGLVSGDIIVQYNGKPVKNMTKFRNEIAMMLPGSQIQLKVMRNKKAMQLLITLGTQDEESSSAEKVQKLGIDLENLTPEWASKLGVPQELHGVVITKVKPNSPAASAGIRSGFIITGMAFGNVQKPVHNVTEFSQHLKEIGDAKYVVLIIRHQNFQRYYTVRLSS